MLKKYLDSLIKSFSKNFNLKKTLISCGVIFLAFLLIFPTGAVFKGTINEACANYYADVAKNHTNDTSKKKLSGLIVEPKDDSGAKMRQDTENAINELWGVFKGNNASFAPVMNANRDYEIYFKNAQFSDDNLSFVYTDVGQSAIAYHKANAGKQNEKVIDYKFQSSPIALMFPSGHSGMQEYLHIYISLAQAERKLTSEGKEITEQTLKEIINPNQEPIQMMVNGVEVDCIIDNIYLDNLPHIYQVPNYDYYYATDIGTVIGDFVFVILYAYKYPNKITPKKQSLYVMSEYSFRNKFTLEYAKESYSPENYSFDYARYNTHDGFIFNDNVLQQTLNNTSSNVWCSLLTILFFAVFAFGCFLIYRFDIFKQPLSLSILAISSFLPYLLFKIIFTIAKNTYIFSSYSLTFNFILLMVLIALIILINCFGRKIKAENKDV